MKYSDDRSGPCLCCGSETQSSACALLSSFLSYRALKQGPSVTQLYECNECGFKWTKRGLSSQEMANLYVGYRGERYFLLRNGYEPWYTKAMNDGIGSDDEMTARRTALSQVLESCQVEISASSRVVDHGGDRGQMLQNLGGCSKYVYEISGVDLDGGVVALGAIEAGVGSFDLALSCHVLEHVNDPLRVMEEVASLVKENGHVYLELPNENWKQGWQPACESKIINWLISHPALLKAADFICTAFRTKIGWIPPLGFAVVREHLQYFNLDSMRCLMERSGLETLYLKEHGQFLIAVGKKFQLD